MTRMSLFGLAAGAILAVAMLPALAGPDLSRFDVSVRPGAEGVSPVMHVSAAQGIWTEATADTVSFSFVIDAAAARGRMTEIALGVPGVYVGADRAIAAEGQAVWHLPVDDGERMNRRIDRGVPGNAIPTLSRQATAACNRLLDHGATTAERVETTILGRARIAVAIEPDGLNGLIADRKVVTDIVRFPIAVVCDAEVGPAMS